jgi:hypothetical protein
MIDQYEDYFAGAIAPARTRSLMAFAQNRFPSALQRASNARDSSLRADLHDGRVEVR